MQDLTRLIKSTRTCMKCSGQLFTYLIDPQITLVCPACRAINELRQGKPPGNGDKIPKNTGEPVLTIGSTGEIRSVKYLVIGYALKNEKNTSYKWEEYILFNPDSGAAYLTVYEGHWTYSRKCPRPEEKSGQIFLDKEVYHLYSSYKARIKQAEGEFPYMFSKTEDLKINEYIRPPYMLSSEEWDDGTKWYKGEYIQPEEIRKGFNIEATPHRSGVGNIQPPSKVSVNSLVNFLLILAAVCAVVQIYFANTAKNEAVFNESFQVTDSSSGKDIYTSSFDLKDGVKNVQVSMSSNVDNSWAYTAMTLVNEKTGETYDLDMEVEYYHGYEGGESWNEGSNKTYKFISSVPEGRYHLVIFPEKPFGYEPLILNITVERDVFVESNGLVLIIILGLYPAFFFLKSHWYEKSRWSKSDYSPYNYE